MMGLRRFEWDGGAATVRLDARQQILEIGSGNGAALVLARFGRIVARRSDGQLGLEAVMAPLHQAPGELGGEPRQAALRRQADD